MPEYDPSLKPNWSFVTPITCPDGTHFRNRNFTQESPWTEPFTAAGLIFEDCNLTNCLLPSDAIIIVAGLTKTTPVLGDGRRAPRQHQYRVTTEIAETELGVWENHEIQRCYRVTGTPTTPVETILFTTDLGPTP